MTYIEILDSINENDMTDILDTWESSVRSTHDFLTEDDILSLKPHVKECASSVDVFFCARNKEGTIKAFMGINGKKIEMLFVSSDYRGKGIGKRLLQHALSIFSIEFIDVNEQNKQAVGFYKYMGFDTLKKSEFDSQGNPFPILHMKLELFSI